MIGRNQKIPKAWLQLEAAPFGVDFYAVRRKYPAREQSEKLVLSQDLTDRSKVQAMREVTAEVGNKILNLNQPLPPTVKRWVNQGVIA